MQLAILLQKDIRALFKQRAVIFTLLIPMFLIIGLGLLPTLLGIQAPVEVHYLNEDQGYEDINLGDSVIDHLIQKYQTGDTIILIEMTDPELLETVENAIWFPANFTEIAQNTRKATYFIKVSENDIQASTIVNSVIVSEIDTVVTEEIIEAELPTVEGKPIFQGNGDSNQEDRARLAFPLAYMSFLILILSSSSMRVTGFAAEREAGMMELLLSTVIRRRDMVLSKLITGTLYGLASVMSYVVGLLVVIFFQDDTVSTEEVALLVLPPELFNPANILVIIFLFTDLSFIAIQILLGAQLLLGREAGDRLGSLFMMILSFFFYFSAITDPLSETGLKVLNPFFWPFRIALDLLFNDIGSSTITYLAVNILFCLYLLLLKTRAIEKEAVLFE